MTIERKRRADLAAIIAATTLMLLGAPLLCWGLQLRMPERAYQGDFTVGRVKPSASVFINGESCPVSDAGYFAVGVSRDRKTDVSVKAVTATETAVRTLRVLAYPWTVQRIDGLPGRYVTPPPQDLKRIEEDNRRVSSVRKSKGLPAPLFLEGGFVPPVEGRITGPFGTQRILNGLPRSPHSGVDFAAPEGSTVFSPAGGVVRLIANRMYLMGNVLMIDHGLGVRSIFIHLQRSLVREGERVEQGQPVALVGKTGRATGPHVHWGVSVGATLVDPARLLGRAYRIP